MVNKMDNKTHGISTEEFLSQLEPSLRKRLSNATDVEITKQKTPSPSLNNALRGGFAYGRQVLVWGNKSAGKSSFCLQMIGEAQKEGKLCAWIDAEQSFDPIWAQKLGVDTDKLIYSEARTINDMVDVATQLMKAKVDILIVDSISALLPAIYFEKDSAELKQLENTKQIGAEAKDMTNAVKMLNYANNQEAKTLLVLISQQRNNIGAMYASHMPTGGQAVKFFSSTVIKLWSSESENQAIKGKITVGDKLIESKIGRIVNWHVDFNKTGPAFISGSYDFYFGSEEIGIDKVADLVDTAELVGVIEKGGAWYTVFEERLQGRAKVIEYLKQNPDKLKELESKLNS
jgi:recombination protein RecA